MNSMIIVSYGVAPADFNPWPPTPSPVPYPAPAPASPFTVDPVPGLVKMLQDATEARYRAERKAEDLEKRIKDLKDRIRLLGFEP